MNDAIEAITKATREWAESFQAGDVERSMAYVAPHAVLVPPHEAPVVGGAAIREWVQAMVETVTVTEARATIDEVRVADGWAVSRGSWHMEMDVGGQDASDTTRYVVVWERGPDGSWKVVHDVWNSATPHPGQE